MAEYNPESGTQKYSKCQTPPYEKNKLTLNEYLGDFMHFESLFFFVEIGQTPPLKCGKFHKFVVFSTI